MNDTLKQILLRFGLPILASVVIGLGSAVLSSYIMNGNLETRVSKLEGTVDDEKLLTRTTNLELQIERHEKALERDISRHEQIVMALGNKTEDQEKRLTRLETLVSETQRLLAEIRTDVKILLRGGQQ